MTSEVLQMLDPSWVVPLVAVLVDKSCQENGAIFEVGGGHFAKYRWERSKGAVLQRDDGFTAGALLQRWNDVNNFQGAEHPDRPMDHSDLTERLRRAQPNSAAGELDFTGKVVLVTGGAAG